MIPEDLLYTPDHEWVRRGTDGSGQVVRVGITDYAQQALGDIVFVSPAEVGSVLGAGTALAEVESTKSVSDVYAPVEGTVVSRNEALDATPELVNSDPYGDGWLVEFEVADPDSLSGLLGAPEYAALIEE